MRGHPSRLVLQPDGLAGFAFLFAELRAPRLVAASLEFLPRGSCVPPSAAPVTFLLSLLAAALIAATILSAALEHWTYTLIFGLLALAAIGWHLRVDRNG